MAAKLASPILLQPAVILCKTKQLKIEGRHNINFVLTGGTQNWHTHHAVLSV